MDTKLVHLQPGYSCVGINSLLLLQTLFSFFHPFFKPLQISSKFRFTPAVMFDINVKILLTVVLIFLTRIFITSLTGLTPPPLNPKKLN